MNPGCTVEGSRGLSKPRAGKQRCLGEDEIPRWRLLGTQQGWGRDGGLAGGGGGRGKEQGEGTSGGKEPLKRGYPGLSPTPNKRVSWDLVSGSREES